MSDTFTDETYNTLCKDAENYLAGGSPEQARELLVKAISLIGTRPKARSILSDTCMSMELWSEARSQLEILITLEDSNLNNNFRLAQVLEELGEYQLAFDNYSVVIEDNPDHHGAAVAIKRISARTKESGVNLADIFATSSTKTETSAPPAKKDIEKLREGAQVFPDVPIDSLFAESEDEQENSIEKLLKNIGLSQEESEEDDSDDISKLLENIGVSTADTLQSVFSETGTEDSVEPDGTEDEESTDQRDSADLQSIISDSESTEEEAPEEEKASTGPTLDEIFGTTSPPSEDEEVTETVEEEAEDQIQEQEEAVPEDSDQQASEAETDTEIPDAVEGTEPVLDSSETLQAIFNEAEAEIIQADSIEEQTAQESESDLPGIEALVSKPQEEEIASEEVKTEEQVQEVEEAEEQIQEEEQAEEQVQEVEETEEQIQEDETVLSIDPWSSDSGLLTAHLTSGSVDIDQCMLTVFEDTLTTDISSDGICKITGCGTFLLNCGPEEPLILELSENMIIRHSALILAAGAISSEPLDGQIDNSLVVLKDQVRVKGVFRTPSPVRVILLGGNKRIFNVRTASIIASDPGIVLSNENSPDDYTAITGYGKLYLIE